jgi:hypothetical protein
LHGDVRDDGKDNANGGASQDRADAASDSPFPTGDPDRTGANSVAGERVRNATRQLQDAPDRLTDTQTKKTELADRTRQLEMPISGELQSR